MAADENAPGQSWAARGRGMVFRLSASGVNVGQSERGVKAVLGGGLVLWGLSRRGAAGTMGAALGAALIGEGVSGHSRLHQWFGIDHAGNTPRPDAACTPTGICTSLPVNPAAVPWLTRLRRPDWGWAHPA